jgi:tripartite-type tricarboxylate transporter receptor subunit TctC
MKRIAAALALVVALAPKCAGHAQTYPSRTIRLIVPFPAGGVLDVMGRLIAKPCPPRSASSHRRQPPGAGSTRRGRDAARAEPDGYTLLLGSATALAIGRRPVRTSATIRSRASPGRVHLQRSYVMVTGPKSRSAQSDVIAYAKANRAS